jgi:hypothetical protein
MSTLEELNALAGVDEAIAQLPETPTWDDASAWPILHEDALHGLAGDFVRRVSPHSEADVSALLAQFLCLFGAAAGPSPHMVVEATTHRARLFVLLAGATATGRKGTSLDQNRRIFRIADAEWLEGAEVGGLASGEALIERLKEREGNPARGRGAVIVEHEFSRIMAVASREGSLLSPIIRDAWDRDEVKHNVRKSPIIAQGIHPAAIAHTTIEELKARLESIEIANGFANRFALVCVRRGRRLPFGGSQLTDHDLAPLGKRLRSALENARETERIDWHHAARPLWERFYMTWPEPTGLLGAVTARTEAQILRVAMLYALLDGERLISVRHLRAAFAFWSYCFDSAQFIFGATLGDNVADRILEALRNAYPAGLDREALRGEFSRHQTSERVARAVATLEARSLARTEATQTCGRPRLTSYALPRAKSAKSAESRATNPLIALLALSARASETRDRSDFSPDQGDDLEFAE